jgi:biopolymer transport protein ExbD/biopolymer transport protein TolR
MDVGDRSLKSDINVTPLVDVVLVLLIIFMVVTPLLHRGKDVPLPEAQRVSALEKGGDPIFVSITLDHRIWLDQTEVRKEDLAEAVSAEAVRRPGTPVLVKGDRGLDYRTIREVITELSKTRLSGVSLVAVEPGQKEGS